MKKLLTSVLLVLVGAGSWWLVSHTARFSLKKWDAKFESVLRHQLNSLGLSNHDVLSSVHEVKKDAEGEWVVHHLTLKLPDAAKRKAIKDEFEESGAKIVEKKLDDGSTFFQVTRGSRAYQEIKFLN